MSAITECATKSVSHGIEFVGFGRRLSVVEIEVLHSLHGYDMEVDVGHLEAGDHQADPFTLDDQTLSFANGPSHLVEVSSGGVVEVEPVIGFFSRDHQNVAGVERADVEHGDAYLVGPNQPTGDLASDDASENRRHGRDGK